MSDADDCPNDLSSLGKAIPDGVKALGALFPGIAIRSASKAEMKVTDNILTDIEKIISARDELGLSDEFASELASNAVRRHGHNDNFRSVLAFAVPHVGPDARPEEVDPAWADNFREHAGKAYDDDARRTWAALLAGEANHPGSFSRHAMSVLAEMGPEDASALRKVCTACVVPLDAKNSSLDPVFVFVLDEDQSGVDGGLLSRGELASLESLGVVSFSTRDVLSLGKGESARVRVADEVVTVKRGGMLLLNPKPSAMLTSVGVELTALCKEGIGTAPSIRELFAKRANSLGMALVNQ